MSIINKLGITPGPWEKYSTTINRTHTIIGRNDGEIGSIICQDLTKGNATIIAAAPEMLEVLIELMEFAEYWSEYDEPIGIHDRMRNAIEKASGRKWNEIKDLIDE